MAEEVIKPEVIKKTQETLGKFIKKPVLTEKLLTKPPFRFLHDICTACMRETGFFEGVLAASDVKVENIKDKDGKIAFLQKVIAAVEAANGVKLAVKPNKVVAGHEPTHTNEFLQALAKAVEKHAAKSGNGGKVAQPGKTKTKTVKKSEKQDAPEKKKQLNSSRQAKSESGGREEAKKKSSGERLADAKKKASVTSIPDEADKAPAREETKPKEEEEEEEKLRKRKERTRLKNAQAPSSPEAEGKGNKAKEKTAEAVEEPEVKRPPSAKPGNRKSESADVAESPPKEPEVAEPPKPEPPAPRIPGDLVHKRPESSFMRMNKAAAPPPPPPSVADPNYSAKDSDAVDEPSPISRPLTGMRPTTGRPASARPAAPRIRDRGEISAHEDIVKPSLGNVQIITDKEEENEAEEDENVVTIEAASEVVDDLDGGGDGADRGGGGGGAEHGLLVEQILETQKELEQVVDNKLTGKTEIEWKSNRNRESTDREIKKLRLGIQTLTRSANPLGKLLDFLQEDVDIMQKELTNWRDMNAELDVEIAQERSLTEQSVEPMKAHLKELQQMIDQQMEQMTVVKANILRNDRKIHKLLTETK